MNLLLLFIIFHRNMV